MTNAWLQLVMAREKRCCALYLASRNCAYDQLVKDPLSELTGKRQFQMQQPSSSLVVKDLWAKPTHNGKF